MKNLDSLIKTVLLLAPFCFVCAQAPEIEWAKSYGGSDGDRATSVQQTTDGGYIVAGYSQSNDGDASGNHGDWDFWIVKTETNGTMEWQKSLGGTGVDQAYSIQQTTDGGYIVGGYSSSINGDVTGNHGEGDFWVVKLAGNGSIQWQKSLGGSNDDSAVSVQQTTDGGYIVAGYSSSINGDVTGNHGGTDFWVVKLLGNGNIQWQKSYGGTDTDIAYSVQQTPDGGYIVAGYTWSNDGDVTGNHGEADFWVVKLAENGNIQWQKTYGGSGTDAANSIQLTADGDYVVAGYSTSDDGDLSQNFGNKDFMAIEIEPDGTLLYAANFGGSNDDIATKVQQTTDGGYIISGYSESTDYYVTNNHGLSDYWLVRINQFFVTQWMYCYGGSENEGGGHIYQTADGGYIVAGYSESNDGDINGDNHGEYDFWLAKLEDETAGVEDVFAQETKIYPNPAKDILYFSEELEHIKIYSVIGAEILEFAQSASIDLKRLAPGTYILKAQTMDGRSVTQKFIKK